jgi:hypothetical protein
MWMCPCSSKKNETDGFVFAARNRQHSLVVSIFTAMSIIYYHRHREAELELIRKPCGRQKEREAQDTCENHSK